MSKECGVAMQDNTEDVRLSGFAKRSLVPSPVARLTSEFAAFFRDGVDINLGVGYVNEETIPSAGVMEAVRFVCTHPHEHRMPLNYGGPEGSANLINAVRRFLTRRDPGLALERLQELRLVIGANGATSILDALGDIFCPGIVVTADPYYYIYCETLKRKGFDIRTVEEGSAGLRPEVLEKFLEKMSPEDLERLEFLYIITVNNPSGNVIPYKDRLGIVRVAENLSAKLGRKIPLFLDCAYDSLNHGAHCPEIRSVLHQSYEIPVFEIGTFSKILAPALRIGYLMGEDSPVISAIVQKTADIGFSNSLIMQEVTAWMLDNVVDKQIQTVNMAYRKKAEAIRTVIEEELSPWLSVLSGGECGFYFYLTFSDIYTDEGSDFYKYLTRTTGIAMYDLCDMDGWKNPIVVYIPGEICQNPDGDNVELGRRQLRLSYGFEELDMILEAVHYMREACEYAEKAAGK